MAIENRGPQLQAVIIPFLIVGVLCFSLRAYVRIWMVKGFGVDDWLMFGATIAFILLAACILTGIHYGTGRHSWDLTAYGEIMARQFWLYCYIGYCWTMILSKLSIGAFLLRLSITRIHRWIIYVAILVNSLLGLVFFFVAILQCHPVSYYWDKVSQSGSCINVDITISLTYVYSAGNIICDLTFSLLPILIVKDLNMERRMKIAIVPLLGMGCVASAAVVVRLAYIQTFRDPDFLYATVDIAMWSFIEGALAIAAGSLACGRPLFREILFRLGCFSPGFMEPVDNVPVHEQRPTIGSAYVRRPSRQPLGTEIISLGSVFNREGGDENKNSMEESKPGIVPTISNHDEEATLNGHMSTIHKHDEELTIIKTPNGVRRAASSSAGSEVTLNSRREIREGV